LQDQEGEPLTQRLRWVPPGRFRMGSPPDEPGRSDNEGPQHDVTLATGFWLFDTQVTQALWQVVMGINPSRFIDPHRPVENVSFEDVKAFLFLVSIRPWGRGLVLPSESQWEYACRAGTEAATYAGPMKTLGERNAPVLDEIAWYGGNSGVDFDLENGVDSSGWPQKQYPHTWAGTRKVAQKRPNPWGLYDMLGNVKEWCADSRHDSYVGAPADGSAWIDLRASDQVVRGGSWPSAVHAMRAAYRYGLPRHFHPWDIGFRCARR
jgi:formylglycine-generating enzyme required for sulfatase activity